MSIRPWMTRRFLVALLAMGVLFVLLLAACFRLIAAENQNRDYITEDMVWLTSQGQYEAVRFADALARYGQGETDLEEPQLYLDLLASRIATIEGGEPLRQLDLWGFSANVQRYRAIVDHATELMPDLQPGDAETIGKLHADAMQLAGELRDAANAALFGRRDRDAAERAE